MKKQIFWKVIIGLLVLWLFLFLWMNQWHYALTGTARTNKITGKTYVLWNDGKWHVLQQTDKK
jgi:hypothetical protein